MEYIIIDINIDVNLKPTLKFNIKPNIGIITILKPRLIASLSKFSKSFFFGYNTNVRIYPGKNSTIDTPNIVLMIFFSKNIIETVPIKIHIIIMNKSKKFLLIIDIFIVFLLCFSFGTFYSSSYKFLLYLNDDIVIHIFFIYYHI